MKQTIGFAAALAVLLAAAGCSSDSSSDASASATPSPAPGFGRATPDDLAHLDLPIYAGASPTNSDFSKLSKNGGYSMTLMMTTHDSYADVEGWYAAHVDSEFTGKHLGLSRDDQSTIYADSEPDDGPPTLQRSVTIASAKDAKGEAIVIVTLNTNSSTTEIPQKDWH